MPLHPPQYWCCFNWIHQGASTPPWLLPNHTPLGPTQATAFTRLLTAICDPTLSSVQTAKHGSKQTLTSATNRARRLAGQHLSYLLIEYSRCQLHSRLPPDVKAALLPGLYAIFDAANQDTLRMINAVSDPASREIFKALYRDYDRFGRWREDVTISGERASSD